MAMNLHQYLRQSLLTQKRFAELTGIKQPTVSHYINGDRLPSRHVMQRIFVITNGQVTPNDFFDLPSPDGQPPPSTL
jgi:transcriptional regulator with XRE-family HTH domain